LKKEMIAFALLAALASFAWPAFLVETVHGSSWQTEVGSARLAG